MDEKLIKKNIKKISEIERYNRAYYDKNSPIISDSEYDSKKIIIDLENKYKFLKNKFTNSNNVGFKPSKNFKKSHKVPMLSLANAFDEKDLVNFEKK